MNGSGSVEVEAYVVEEGANIRSLDREDRREVKEGESERSSCERSEDRKGRIQKGCDQ